MKTLTQNQKSKIATLSMVCISILAPTMANASDAVGPGDSNSTWVVGVAAGASKNPYVGEDEETWISPTIRYNGERFFVKESSLNMHITQRHGFSAGLKLALDGGFLSDKDNFRNNEKLASLKERDATILGGIYVIHDTNLGRLSFDVLTDAANEHDGRIAQLKYTFDFNAGNWSINPEVGAEWLSSNYADHYVGVTASEANSSLLEYKSQDTLITSAGIRTRYAFNDNWDIDFKVAVSKLGRELKESPLIEDDVIYQASLGVNYNF